MLKDLSRAPPALKLFVDYCKSAPELESNPSSPWKGMIPLMHLMYLYLCDVCV